MERRDAHRWGLIQEFYAKRAEKKTLIPSHRIHVWYINLHLP